MNDNVKNVKDLTPNPELIKQLESMLRDAKSGELRSIVSVCAWDDDTTSNAWIHDKRNTYRRILGELSMLQHDFVVSIAIGENRSVLSKALNDEL